MIDEFFYFVNERHRIYLRKEAGKPWPWTKDENLQAYSFTNVYRPLDAVTIDLRNQVSDRFMPWYEYRRLADQLVFEIIGYRLPNWPPTYRLLRRLLRKRWDPDKALAILREAQDRGDKIFTGAYIITNNGETRPKIELICEAISAARDGAARFVKQIRAHRTLAETTALFEAEIPCVGNFVAYEFACDLRWTPLLIKAPDIMTWANPGPGAMRGLNRIHGRPVKTKPPRWQLIEEMRDLLKESQRPGRLKGYMLPLEMRDVEHSLCELQKYLKAKNGEGRPRSRYWPPGHPNRAPDWRN